MILCTRSNAAFPPQQSQGASAAFHCAGIGAGPMRWSSEAASAPIFQFFIFVTLPLLHGSALPRRGGWAGAAAAADERLTNHLLGGMVEANTPSDGGFGVSATIRLPSFSFEEDHLSFGGAEGGASASSDDSAWASKGSAGAGVIVVAGAATQLGLHFIRLLIESRDFGSILVRGLVPAPPRSAEPASVAKLRASLAVANARASLDRFCGEDTSLRVELVAVPYVHASVVVEVDGTVGTSLDPREQSCARGTALPPPPPHRHTQLDFQGC